MLAQIIISGMLLLLAPLSVRAHDGTLAIAMPMDKIAVDGDFSDWPEGLESQPIAFRISGAAIRSAQDFKADFRVGYNEDENAVYLAIEVADESILGATAENGIWNTQDGVEVYADITHTLHSVLPLEYAIWGESLWGMGGGSAGDTEVGIQRGENYHRYEWKMDIGKATVGEVQITSGMVLGFSPIVWDVDEDGSLNKMAWGAMGSQHRYSSHLGDLVLSAKKERRGTVRGKVFWDHSGAAIAHSLVRLQSLDYDDLWLGTHTDTQGRFILTAPPGAYRVIAASGKEDSNYHIELTPAGEADLEIAVHTSAGNIVQAGPGKAIRASQGAKKGNWTSWGIGDGVLPSSVEALYQDREGNIWIGSGFPYHYKDGGLSKYDGVQFVHYSVADGLPHDKVSAIIQDREGAMWLGTRGGGIARYDGETFVHFNVENGLAGDTVLAILEDRNGNLWVGTSIGLSRRDASGVWTTYNQVQGLISPHINALMQDRDGLLWIGTEMGVCTFDGAAITCHSEAGGGPKKAVDIAQDHDGNIWVSSPSSLACFDHHQWRHFTPDQMGMDDDVDIVFHVAALNIDRDGYLWASASGSGVLRYDGEIWQHYTPEDGLGSSQVYAIMEDREGNTWFGAMGGTLSRYERHFQNYTTANGLVHNLVISLAEDREGNIWFGTTNGVSKFDGHRFVNLTAADGLPVDEIMDIVQTRDGDMWFATLNNSVLRYDGRRMHQYTNKNGFGGTGAWAMVEDRDGDMWFGTRGDGISRFDGQRWINYTTRDGLPDNSISSAYMEEETGYLWFGTTAGEAVKFDGEKFESLLVSRARDDRAIGGIPQIIGDRSGNIWFATFGAGVSRYDGRAITRFPRAKFLPHDKVRDLMEDRRGHLWFGSYGAGISLWDGTVVQRMMLSDGLGSELIRDMIEAKNGDVWIAHEGGATRYRAGTVPPNIVLLNVTADRNYGPVEEVRLSSTQDFLAFEFRGANMRTRSDRMVYVYRLLGHDDAWRQINEGHVEYSDLPVGEYIFEAKSVDIDLLYSEKSISVKVVVLPPYGLIALWSGLGLALVALLIASGATIKRHRAFLREQQGRLQAQERLNRELEDELRTAHDMQMGLMPTDSPQVAGYDISGRCLPAVHVGGDFFQYFEQNGKLAVCMADVTGHGMEAAVPVMMFSGILESEIKYDYDLSDLYAILNQTLYNKLDLRTFVCFAMGRLDLHERSLSLANGGCPYPYHYRAATGEITELDVNIYPLGVRASVTYPVIEVALASGDYVVFCSDGIVEAANAEQDIFGYEQTAAMVRAGCSEGLTAAALIDRIVGAVQGFTGDKPQEDDMTCVVLRVES